ncbi:MAG: DUF3047 domain-containing protein [Planktomarina sp.]
MKFLLSFIISVMWLQAASADQIDFRSGWKNQRLSLFSTNRYNFGKSTLGLTSNGAVSIAWSRVDARQANSRRAAWSWRVDQSVVATDLSRKGGDDRNISLYFVYLPESEAAKLQGASIRALLGNKSVRVLQYAWGGNHGRGTFIPSPYGPAGQGVTVALRQAGTGAHSESRDLARDYKRAFGGQIMTLVGLAVSGDSDDTDGAIKAQLSGLTLN